MKAMLTAVLFLIGCGGPADLIAGSYLLSGSASGMLDGEPILTSANWAWRAEATDSTHVGLTGTLNIPTGDWRLHTTADCSFSFDVEPGQGANLTLSRALGRCQPSDTTIACPLVVTAATIAGVANTTSNTLTVAGGVTLGCGSKSGTGTFDLDGTRTGGKQ